MTGIKNVSLALRMNGTCDREKKTVTINQMNYTKALLELNRMAKS